MSVSSLSSSSFDADSNLNKDLVCLLVEQLKVYALRDDLFQRLEQDYFVESDIRKLLKQLGGRKLLEFVVPFMLDFEPVFSQISQMIEEK